MVHGDVIVFKVVATLGDAATATLGGVAVSTLGAVGTRDWAPGWADMIAVSCWMAARCFIFALAEVGMVPPSCSNMSLAASSVLSFLDKMGIWQWVWIEPPSVRETETPGQWDVKTETLAVIDCGAYVETISSTGCPGGSSVGVVVNQGLHAKWSKRRFVEIKWAVEFVVG
jgi:hypothetical protein